MRFKHYIALPYIVGQNAPSKPFDQLVVLDVDILWGGHDQQVTTHVLDNIKPQLDRMFGPDDDGEYQWEVAVDPQGHFGDVIIKDNDDTCFVYLNQVVC